MKKTRLQIGVTLRSETLVQINETRNSVDQNLLKWVFQNGDLPILLPNSVPNPSDYAEQIGLDGIIFSGGNDLSILPNPRDACLQRDRTERDLLIWAKRRNVPVLGICRGMQLILAEEGIVTKLISSHVRVRHNLKSFHPLITQSEVNSFHNFGFFREDIKKPFLIGAETSDGSVEAILDSERSIVGIMWHPEREMPFTRADNHLYNWLFKSKVAN